LVLLVVEYLKRKLSTLGKLSKNNTLHIRTLSKELQVKRMKRSLKLEYKMQEPVGEGCRFSDASARLSLMNKNPDFYH
jgi:hypothetical protein